eukprot:m.152173 g.152173  ORF g.152173 m.152173 type:complete len:990 (-) comp13299_c6_seq2:1182-4151(-)
MGSSRVASTTTAATTELTATVNASERDSDEDSDKTEDENDDDDDGGSRGGLTTTIENVIDSEATQEGAESASLGSSEEDDDDDEDYDDDDGDDEQINTDGDGNLVQGPKTNCLDRHMSSSLPSTLSSRNHKDRLDTKYVLHGVVVHMGSARAGHYYAFARVRETPSTKHSGTANRWIKFNDTNVNYQLMNESFMKEALFGNEYAGRYGGSEKNYSAYLLIYERKDVLKELNTETSSLVVMRKALDQMVQAKAASIERLRSHLLPSTSDKLAKKEEGALQMDESADGIHSSEVEGEKERERTNEEDDQSLLLNKQLESEKEEAEAMYKKIEKLDNVIEDVNYRLHCDNRIARICSSRAIAHQVHTENLMFNFNSTIYSQEMLGFFSAMMDFSPDDEKVKLACDFFFNVYLHMAASVRNKASRFWDAFNFACSAHQEFRIAIMTWLCSRPQVLESLFLKCPDTKARDKALAIVKICLGFENPMEKFTNAHQDFVKLLVNLLDQKLVSHTSKLVPLLETMNTFIMNGRACLNLAHNAHIETVLIKALWKARSPSSTSSLAAVTTTTTATMTTPTATTSLEDLNLALEPKSTRRVMSLHLRNEANIAYDIIALVLKWSDQGDKVRFMPANTRKLDPSTEVFEIVPALVDVCFNSTAMLEDLLNVDRISNDAIDMMVENTVWQNIVSSAKVMEYVLNCLFTMPSIALPLQILKKVCLITDLVREHRIGLLFNNSPVLMMQSEGHPEIPVVSLESTTLTAVLQMFASSLPGPSKLISMFNFITDVLDFESVNPQNRIFSTNVRSHAMDIFFLVEWAHQQYDSFNSYGYSTSKLPRTAANQRKLRMLDNLIDYQGIHDMRVRALVDESATTSVQESQFGGDNLMSDDNTNVNKNVGDLVNDATPGDDEGSVMTSDVGQVGTAPKRSKAEPCDRSHQTRVEVPVPLAENTPPVHSQSDTRGFDEGAENEETEGLEDADDVDSDLDSVELPTAFPSNR